jgi:hypothetical protein
MWCQQTHKASCGVTIAAKNRHQDNDERSERGRAWQNNPYFGELARPRIDLD